MAFVASSHTIAPREVVERRVVWNGSLSPADPHAPRAPAGQYWITADFGRSGKPWDTKARRNVLLR